MLKNYLLVTLRNIRKFKVFSFINIVGLSTSLAIIILIVSYAEMELSINKFHENYDHIYKVGKGNTAAPVADIIKLNIPEVEKITRIENFRTTSVTMKYGDNPLIVKNIIFADPDFFDIFTLPVIRGDIKTAMNEPMSLILTETEAKRIFGNKDPMNKNIKMDGEFNLVVKAIIKDVPDNSSMLFNGIIPFASIKEMIEQLGYNFDPYSWSNYNYETYLISTGKLSITDLKKRIELVLKNNAPKVKEYASIDLYPLKDIYYNPELSGFHYHGSIEKSFTLLSIAILILFIAVINFTNLSTARASMRSKEMGVRKTIGASRFTLIQQFLSESIVLSFISFTLAILIASEIIPIFSDLINLKLLLFPNFIFIRIMIIAAAALLLGILAGIYPAFYLTSFKPDLILRGKTHQGGGKAFLRRILIVFQFTIAIVLIISTVVIYKQTEFIRNKPLGFQKENIIYFPTNKQISSKEDLFKTRVLQHSAVSDFAYSFAIPGEMGMSWGQPLNYEGKESNVWFTAVPITSDFIRLMKMKLIEGRSFLTDNESDIGNIIINEAFTRKYGLTKPFEARLTGMGKGKGNVVGIVKDFNFQSLHSDVQPLVFINYPGYYSCGLVKIKSTKYDDIKGVIENLKSVWKDISPEFPFQYYFLDDRLSLQYTAEEKFEEAFIGFSLLSIIIGCLGLFGLSSFTTEQRTKEIGIRKILGASILSITGLISKQFVLLVLISNIIAWPIAYYVTNNWLQDFSYKIDITLWMFVLAGGVALVIALLTVSFQAVKAATANPVEALRYE
jgi:putative ABC transport system permease protein